jgi:hypothetical protein
VIYMSEEEIKSMLDRRKKEIENKEKEISNLKQYLLDLAEAKREVEIERDLLMSKNAQYASLFRGMGPYNKLLDLHKELFDKHAESVNEITKLKAAEKSNRSIMFANEVMTGAIDKLKGELREERETVERLALNNKSLISKIGELLMERKVDKERCSMLITEVQSLRSFITRLP